MHTHMHMHMHIAHASRQAAGGGEGRQASCFCTLFCLRSVRYIARTISVIVVSFGPGFVEVGWCV